MSSRTSVSINPECIEAFNELKLGKNIKYIILRLTDDYKEVVLEEKSDDKDFDNFRNKLLEAKSSVRGKEGKGPRYAVYDFEYELEAGEGTRNKIAFIFWCPDEGALIQPKMTYASAKEPVKQALNGIATDIQANSENDIEYDTIVEGFKRSRR